MSQAIGSIRTQSWGHKSINNCLHVYVSGCVFRSRTFGMNYSSYLASITSLAGPQTLFTSAVTLPPKLAKKILDLEYMDMTGLVPNTWRYMYSEDKGAKCCHQPRHTSCWAPVSNKLLQWNAILNGNSASHALSQ